MIQMRWIFIYGLKGPRIAKIKVEPLTQQTIPRLEFLSGLLLARLVKIVKKTFELFVQGKNVFYLGE